MRSTGICVMALLLAATMQYGVAQDCLSENGVDSRPSPSRADLYRGQQAFSIAMLDAIQKATPNENIFFSPYSTYHALLLAYFGAKNDTEKELIKVLGLQWAKDKAHVQSGYRLEKQLRHTRSKKMPLEFSAADKIYFAKEVELTSCIGSVFRDEVESKDFLANAEQSRQEINAWIAKITQNEIPEMLSSGDVSSETELLLANAAYFKGQWESKFDRDNTKQEIFYTTKTKQSFVPMMHRRGTYDLTVDETLGAYVARMPYLTSNEEDSVSDISMILILPTFEPDSLNNVLSKLTPDTLDQALRESMPREIDISLPKFEFEQNIELLPILRKMGINSIFDNTADLSGFSTSKKLMFGDAKHVAKIKVDEEGSTAAAATVLFSFRSARPVEPTKLEFNHPFLFIIYDHVARAVLFTGIYRDPMTQK